jgi:DNA polymerase III sliding clamp (beta) subunit (PCNA family)
VADGSIKTAGTDGVVLAEFKSEVDSGNIIFECMIPIKVVNKMVRLLNLSTEDDIGIYYDESLIWVSSSNYIVGGRTLLGRYVDYEQMFSSTSVDLVVDKTVFYDNIKSLDLFDVDEYRITVAVNDGSMVIKNKFADNDGIDVKCNKDFVLDFNVRYLKMAVSAIKSDFVKISFMDAEDPGCVYLYPVGYEGFRVALATLIR